MSVDLHQLLFSTLCEWGPLSEGDKEIIYSRFKPVTFKKKQRLIKPEQVSNSYVFIATGLARLYGYKDGEEKTLFFFKEGMFAGSIESYMLGKPSALVLEAIEDINGLEAVREDLEYAFGTSPALAKSLMTYTQLRLNGLLHYFSSFVLDSPEERYEKFIMTEPELFNRVPQHVIASFLGITPVSLSRIRRRIAARH